MKQTKQKLNLKQTLILDSENSIKIITKIKNYTSKLSTIIVKGHSW